MEYIKYGTKRIEYSVKRGKRKKTVAINVTPAAQTLVLAPYSLSREKIEKIITNKARWILEKQDYFKRLATLFPEKEFISGEQVLFLGRKYRLKINEVQGENSKEPRVIGRRIFISIGRHLNQKGKKEIIKNILVKWYYAQSAEIISQRVKRYGEQLGITLPDIIIKDQKKRWGSCSNNGVLRFNWKITMAPVSIIDYIVVHELCHLKIKNHSSDFWKRVSFALPDYRERREWLKTNTPLLKL